MLRNQMQNGRVNTRYTHQDFDELHQAMDRIDAAMGPAFLLNCTEAQRGVHILTEITTGAVTGQALINPAFARSSGSVATHSNLVKFPKGIAGTEVLRTSGMVLRSRSTAEQNLMNANAANNAALQAKQAEIDEHKAQSAEKTARLEAEKAQLEGDKKKTTDELAKLQNEKDIAHEKMLTETERADAEKERADKLQEDKTELEVQNTALEKQKTMLVAKNELLAKTTNHLIAENDYQAAEYSQQCEEEAASLTAQIKELQEKKGQVLAKADELKSIEEDKKENMGKMAELANRGDYAAADELLEKLTSDQAARKRSRITYNGEGPAGNMRMLQ